MAAKTTVKKEVPPALEQTLKVLADQYDISEAFQNILQEKIEKATKPPSLSERFKSGGLFGLAKDALSQRAQRKIESKTSATNQQLDTSTDNKNILQKFLGLGNIFKLGNLLSPAKKDNKQVTADTPVLPTTNNKTTERVPTVKPAVNKEKDLIKDTSNIQTVLIGGVTDEGARNLQEKMPIILKDVLDELRKIFKEKETTVKPTTTDTSEDGGGLIGNLLDFFQGRGGKKAARAKRGTRSRNSRARKLRAQRAAQKASTGTTLKTAEKAETKAATKTSEKAAAKAATKTLGKTAAKAGGKALGKTIAKRIPGLGLVAGLGFGAQRAFQGDWLGAAGEVASGSASLLDLVAPGVGTATGLGIDAALAARDIYKETQPSPAEQPSEAATETLAPTPEKGLEGNEQLKPVFTTPEASNVQPPIQPVPQPTTGNPTAAPNDGNKDILSKIAENTGNTNSSINTLVQAIYKLAQSISKGGSAPVAPIIMNNQQQSSGPSASQIAASNNDPIRGVRSQFNP